MNKKIFPILIGSLLVLLALACSNLPFIAAPTILAAPSPYGINPFQKDALSAISRFWLRRKERLESSSDARKRNVDIVSQNETIRSLTYRPNIFLQIRDRRHKIENYDSYCHHWRWIGRM